MALWPIFRRRNSEINREMVQGEIKAYIKYVLKTIVMPNQQPYNI